MASNFELQNYYYKQFSIDWYEKYYIPINLEG